MPDAPDDPELERLLDAYGDVCRRYWLSEYRVVRSSDQRAALLAYLAHVYIRRDRTHDDGPWEPGDGSAYAAALGAEDDGNAAP